jgi:hypothetical protein
MAAPENIDPPLNPEAERTHKSTEEPLSPELRVAIREELKKRWYFTQGDEYRSRLKWGWYDGEGYPSLGDGHNPMSRFRCGFSNFVCKLCNKLTAFYWRSEPKDDPHALSAIPFRCFFSEWFKYHDGEPDIGFDTFFKNLVRVLSMGPTTIRGIVEARKRICDKVVAAWEQIDGKPTQYDYYHTTVNTERNYRRRHHYTFKPTYRATITIMGEYVELDQDAWCINMAEHSRKQTILLVRTGDNSHTSAPNQLRSPESRRFVFTSG